MNDYVKILLAVVFLVVIAVGAYFSVESKGKEVTYTMYGEISSAEKHQQIGEIILGLSKKDKLNLRIKGPGGVVDTVAWIDTLVNQEDSPQVTVYVDGPALSADAVLAFVGNKVVISKYSYFMFHKPAFVNSLTGEEAADGELCVGDKGKLDRGQDSVKKCTDYYYYNLHSSDELIEKATKYLTKDELARYNKGEDVYISGKDMNKRVNGGE